MSDDYDFVTSSDADAGHVRGVGARRAALAIRPHDGQDIAVLIANDAPDTLDKPLTFKPVGRSLARSGRLDVRLATREDEIEAAQALRYEVFFEGGSATPCAYSMLTRRDTDRFDAFCDHLIVTDHDAAPHRRVVGTYRLLAQDRARAAGGFYTAGEFAIEQLAMRRPDLKILELGRSCVRAGYRDRATLELLWAGIWAFVQASDADLLIGCASFEGTDPAQHALALSYLHHNHRARGDLAIGPVEGRHTAMDMLPAAIVDPRRAIRALPPLIKGYLNLGAVVGEAAVIDHEFGTTDVLVMLERSAIQDRYKRRFGAERRDAA